MEQKLAILLIEDNVSDAELVLRILKKSEYAITWQRVETADELKDALLTRRWDFVLCDYNLPAFDPMSALSILKAFDEHIPFIVVSGNIGEEAAVEMMRYGAQDYLIKDRLTRLLPVIRRELADAEIKRENVRAAKKLKENEEFFKATLENTTIGVALMSLEGKFLNVNDTFCKILGYLKEELINLTFNEITYPEDRNTGNALFFKMLNGEIDKAEFEKRYVHKSGKIVWAIISGVIVRNPENRSPYILTSILDITGRKNTEEELIKAKDAAEEANVLKSSLMMNMNHEVRTPMNAILGFSSLIFEHTTDDDIRSMAKRIAESGQRLMKTLDDIIELTQLESGREIKHLSTIKLEEKLGAITNSYIEAAALKGISLELNIADSIKITTEIDLLSKCIGEILNNAIKFTENGTVSIQLAKVETPGGAEVEIKIKDTGIGIPPEYHESIFESFVQVSSGYGRSFEGIGIGLTIAKKAILLLNGKILLTSNPGEGSEFSIRLPFDQRFSTSPIAGKIQHKSLPSANTDINQNQAKKRKCLLVEDNDDNAYITRSYLPNEIEMDHAFDQRQAIDLCIKNTYDFILMDINLGIGMDGLDAVAMIRLLPNYLTVPIVALTGYTAQFDKIKFFNMGCTHYLGKPFKREQLLQLVDQLFIEQ
jgi:PAS domain S-box-containing protein